MTVWRVHARVMMGNHYLKHFDLPDTLAGRWRLVERLDRRAVEEEIKKCGMPVVAEEVDARCSQLRRGWSWGSEEFAAKLRGKLFVHTHVTRYVVASCAPSPTRYGAYRFASAAPTESSAFSLPLGLCSKQHSEQILTSFRHRSAAGLRNNSSPCNPTSQTGIFAVLSQSPWAL